LAFKKRISGAMAAVLIAELQSVVAGPVHLPTRISAVWNLISAEEQVTTKVAFLDLAGEQLSSTVSDTMYVPATSGSTEATFPFELVS
jgi:hypothetical protein